MINQFVNALTLKLDGGEGGADKPETWQVAVAWGGVGFLLSSLLR